MTTRQPPRTFMGSRRGRRHRSDRPVVLPGWQRVFIAAVGLLGVMSPSMRIVRRQVLVGVFLIWIVAVLSGSRFRLHWSVLLLSSRCGVCEGRSPVPARSSSSQRPDLRSYWPSTRTRLRITGSAFWFWSWPGSWPHGGVPTGRTRSQQRRRRR